MNNHNTSNSNSRNSRTFIAGLLTYVLLASQLTPLAFATTSPSFRGAPTKASDIARGEKAGRPSVAAEPVSLAPQPLAAPNIVATKVDSYPSVPGPANPGEVITYDVTISNTGTADATGVVFNDTIDPNTTLVPGSVNTQPITTDDSYNVLGNVRIQPNAAAGLLANDIDPDTGTNAGLTASAGATSTQGGSVSVNADGSFSYNPPAGFEGTDTFTYTVTDSGGKTDTGTVTLTITGMIWFINAAAGGGGDGRLTAPFNCLTGGGCFSSLNDGVGNHPAANDSIFLFTGAYTGGLTLLNNQKLIGQAASAALATIAVVTVPANSDALPSTGGASPIITSGANGVNIDVGGSNTLRGFTIGNTTGAKLASGANFGTLTLGNNGAPDLLLNGAGQALNLTSGAFAATSGLIGVASTSSASQGILLSSVAGAIPFGSTMISGNATQCILVTGSTANINFGNTSCTGGTDGVSLQNNSSGTRTFGTLSVSGGSGNAFLHANGGGNTTIGGAAILASGNDTIDIANAANGTLINFANGAAVTKSTAGGEGVHWSGTNTGATLTFDSLNITTTNGSGNTAGITASGGGAINVTNGTGSIASSLGPAITANGIALNANFANVSSSGSTFTAIGLTNVTGTSNFGGGSLATAAGSTFFVSGGTPTVTYNGSITQNTGQRVIDIQNTSAGTITLGGSVTGGASSTGVILNADNGNVSFSTLNLGTIGSRMTNQAVTITGGTGTYGLGTVNIFTNGAQGIVATNADGTLTSTTGTVDATSAGAINIDGPAGLTTLGMTLTSITSSGGTADGISIQDTNGTFTVAGTGGSCTSSVTCTGGTIASKTGADGNTQGTGIFVNNAAGVSITRMKLNDFSNYAVRGTNASSFTMNNCFIDGLNGDNAGADEGSIIFDGLSGTSSFSTDTIKGGIEDNFRIKNSSGTANITVDSCTIRDTSTGVTGNDNLNIEANTTANTTAHVTNNTFAATNGDHIQINTINSATMTIVITGNFYSGGGGGSALGQGITLSGGNLGSTEQVNFNISNNGSAGNPLVGNIQGGAINVNEGQGAGTWQGQVANNFIGNAGVANSGSAQSSGIRVENHSTSGTLTAIISGNTVRQWNNGPGINTQAGDAGNASNTGVLNVTVTNNTVANPGASAQHGFVANIGAGSGSGTAANQACTDVRTNTLDGNAGNGGSGVRLRQREVSTIRIPGYTGTQFDTTAVMNFEMAQNPGNTAVIATSSAGGGYQNTAGPGNPCTQPIVPTAPLIIDVATPDAPPAGTAKTNIRQPRGTNGTAAAFQSSLNQSAETASTPNSAIGASKSLDLNKWKRDGGTVLSYSAKDTFAPLVGQQPIASQGKRARGVISIPRMSPTPLTNAGPINIGTLRPGDSVTITFQVTVNNPYLGGPNVSNQGVISGTNFSNVLTDDPAVGGTADPTLTPINAPPNINVSDAAKAEPASGSAPMLFTVSLSAPASASGVTVHYATADQAPGPGHAVAGQDYTAVPDTILTFTSGEQIKTVSVDILADAIVEPDETFLLNLSNATGGNIVDSQAIGTITTNAPGTFIVSELRTSGPGGAGDDFVELYNNTDSPLTVAATDASAGYGVFKMGADCNAVPVLIATIPNGTVIPARGHYLLVGSQYSLGLYATGDQTLTADIESDRNVAVFSTADLFNVSSATRLDAVGFGANTGGNVCDLLREGTNLPAVGVTGTEHSFFRDSCGKAGSAALGVCPSGGSIVDNNNNSTDFIFADTQGTFISGLTQRLGAPGPENSTSPIVRNSTIAGVLLDATKAAASVPNRVRDLTSNPGNNSTFGTLSIRRRIVNNTGTNITRLRYRIIDTSSFPSPGGGVADLRAITSVNVVVSGVNDPATCLASTGSNVTPCTVTVLGTTLEAPPTQPNGGALNSSLASGTVTLGTPLAPGASVNVQFLLGVQTTGSFKFYVNIEALP